jgi:hypothetical protein
MSVGAAVALALALALAFAAPALALEPGVHVDPGSPAGKEYAIPLSALRAAGSGRAAIEGVEQPLFGLGVRPPGVRGKAVPGAARGGSPHARPGATAGVQPGGRARAGERLPAEGSVVPKLTDRGSPVPEVALIGTLVVLGARCWAPSSTSRDGASGERGCGYEPSTS